MKMKKIVLAAVLALTLAACSDEADTPIDTNDVVAEISEVEIEFLTPQQLNVNEPVKLEVKLTQGDEIINDADDVQFEVWQSGLRDEGELIEGEFIGDGVFSAETTFKEDGIYYMYAHTNARGMHVMPKLEMTVGNPDMSKVLPDDSTDSMEHLDELLNEEHDEHDGQNH